MPFWHKDYFELGAISNKLRKLFAIPLKAGHKCPPPLLCTKRRVTLITGDRNLAEMALHKQILLK